MLIDAAQNSAFERKKKMSKFVVLTDSTCDLPDELAKQHDIDILCFKIALDGEGYTERVDFTPEQFCQMLRNATGLPTTAQITQFEFMERFEEYDRQGVEQALYISINAGGSGTNAAAHAAAAQFREEHPESRMEIFIVDSHAYSMAEGAGVIEAKRRLDDGETMEAVVEYLNDKYARMEILLTAYTLKVIRKSGRISAAAAFAGGVLAIKPVITLRDGAVVMAGKARGSKMGNNLLAQQIQKAGGIDFTKPVLLVYTGLSDVLLQKYIEDSSYLWSASLDAVRYMSIGSVIGAHAGPGAIAVAFFRK